MFLGAGTAICYSVDYTAFKRINVTYNKLSEKVLLDRRQYSTLNRITSSEIERADFIEWFRGFTDAEGCFMIKPVNDRIFGFLFEIGLHVYDTNVLHFIQKTLGIGKVSTYGARSYFRVSSQKDIKNIIDIFSNSPLNTIKHLNFLDFKKAFELYTNTKEKTLQLKKEIDIVKGNMNSLRSDYELPKEYIITSYWLIGFVEGDGSFYILSKDFELGFALRQTALELPLLEAIKSYLLKLPGHYSIKRGSGVVVKKNKSVSNSKPMASLTISNNSYLANVLIPLLDSLVWQSKKELDYKDWKYVMQFKKEGKHYLEEGINLIGKIINQMNNRRLSSSSSFKNQEGARALLQLEIDKLLSAPSNFEVREDGKIFIKSLKRYYFRGASISTQLQDVNGVVIETFKSLADCVKYLGISRAQATKKLHKNEPILFNSQLLYIKKVKYEIT